MVNRPLDSVPRYGPYPGGMKNPEDLMQARSTLPLAASVLAGVGASVCCVLPLVLVLAGLGGSWLSILRSFEPVRPYFAIAAVIALGFAWHGIFRNASACEPGQVCAAPAVQRRRKVLFWIVAAAVIGLLTFPYYAFLFY